MFKESGNAETGKLSEEVLINRALELFDDEKFYRYWVYGEIEADQLPKELQDELDELFASAEELQIVGKVCNALYGEPPSDGDDTVETPSRRLPRL